LPFTAEAVLRPLKPSCSRASSTATPISITLAARSADVAATTESVPFLPERRPEGTTLGGWMLPNSLENKTGCRVTIRTDGRPEDAGRLLSRDFVVDQANAEIHITQRFTVTWKSEVSPGNCCSYDTFSQSWIDAYHLPQCP
jgi:hypothetical protein